MIFDDGDPRLRHGDGSAGRWQAEALAVRFADVPMDAMHMDQPPDGVDAAPMERSS